MVYFVPVMRAYRHSTTENLREGRAWARPSVNRNKPLAHAPAARAPILWKVELATSKVLTSGVPSTTLAKEPRNSCNRTFRRSS